MSDPQTVECDFLVLGAGVIGLAIARELAARGSVVVIEKNSRFGEETSSRNSEVIHSGIYYPGDSWKARLCLRGRELLYPYLLSRGIAFAKTGKWVVACSEEESSRLSEIEQHARSVGAPVRRVAAGLIDEQAPLLKVQETLEFPETGILDSHGFMLALKHEAEERGALLFFQHSATKVSRRGSGWAVDVTTPDGEVRVFAPVVVNAAGLLAAKLSNSALDTNRFEHRLCQGRYFALRTGFRPLPRRLIYPLPQKDGLGVHVTLDLAGAVRFGPDVGWLDVGVAEAEWYRADWESLLPHFVAAVQRYWPRVSQGDLFPHQVGLRPKLFVDGAPLSDFLIEHYDGWVHLLGIESPGLTAALAIAERVGKIL